MDDNTRIKVVNRNNGPTGYTVKELNIRRQFAPREEKMIPFGELLQLSYTKGGLNLLKKYLVIRDEEARKEILPNVEPEYYYNSNDVKRILTQATYNEFLDCLDFAPQGVIDILKDMAVEVEINDLRKRKAIFDKTGFDVTKAIEIKNTKFDGGDEDPGTPQKAVRRAAKPIVEESAPTTPTRRYTVKKDVNVETSAE